MAVGRNRLYQNAGDEQERTDDQEEPTERNPEIKKRHALTRR
jgi:hypothetical protein